MNQWVTTGLDFDDPKQSVSFRSTCEIDFHQVNSPKGTHRKHPLDAKTAFLP